MHGSPRARRMRHSIRFVVLVWLALTGAVLLAACGDEDDSTPAADTRPTRTLPPASPTPTPVRVTPSPTPTDLPAPAALVPTPSPASNGFIPAAAQRLIDLTTDDLVDEQGVTREALRLLSLESFVWRDAAWGCDARFEPGRTAPDNTRGFRLIYSTGRRIFAYHTDEDATFFLCPDRAWLDLAGRPIPLDPIAEAIVELTRRDAAQRLDLSARELRVLSLVAVTWPDTSLGCPRPNAEYADDDTPGYRVVLRGPDADLIYHTSVRDFVLCTAQEEILPGALRDALPTPTPTP